MSKVNTRRINAYLKSKGLDPLEFWNAQEKSQAVLTRKQKATIERLVGGGYRVWVYMKNGKFVIRDADRKYNFEDPSIGARARALANAHKDVKLT